MDFSWSKDQEQLKKSAIKFAASKLNDNIIRRDKNAEFHRKGWQLCVDFGLQGMFLPKALGGSGLEPLDIIAILEGIGYGCKDNGLIFSINAQIWGCQMVIYLFGSDEQKNKYLPELCKGKLIGAHAMTEPNSGSDVYALKTTAIKKNNFYVLKGSKTFITNAPLADIFIVYARTGSTKDFSGISCFLVEKGIKGLTVEKPLEKLGLKTSPMSGISLDNCKISRENLIGKEGRGAIIFHEIMQWERIFILANTIGIMERQLDVCVEYAKERKPADTPISKYQSVANKIVDMKMRLESSRLMLYKAAWMKSRNKSALLESSMAKLHVSEAYVQNSRDAIQIYGGYGYMVEYEFERELRDALASTIYSGTSEIQKNIIAGLTGL
jgi:hypothetical protein